MPYHYEWMLIMFILLAGGLTGIAIGAKAVSEKNLYRAEKNLYRVKSNGQSFGETQDQKAAIAMAELVRQAGDEPIIYYRDKVVFSTGDFLNDSLMIVAIGAEDTRILCSRTIDLLRSEM